MATQKQSQPRAETPFPDLERDVTLGLLVLNLFVFLIEPSLRDSGRNWFEMRYSLSMDGIKAGYWWQFFTYQFLHGNWVHLGANLVLLHSMGPILETTMGRRRFFALYLVSGAMGGLVQLAGAAISPKIFGHPVVGASAGLCGLLAALGALYAEEKVKGYLFFIIPFELKAKIVLLLAGLLSIVGSVFPFGNIAHLAHLGGLLGGLCCVNIMNVKPLPPIDDDPAPTKPGAR
jgi:membrane associated rhomboid family serine protease